MNKDRLISSIVMILVSIFAVLNQWERMGASQARGSFEPGHGSGWKRGSGLRSGVPGPGDRLRRLERSHQPRSAASQARAHL